MRTARPVLLSLLFLGAGLAICADARGAEKPDRGYVVDSSNIDGRVLLMSVTKKEYEEGTVWDPATSDEAPVPVGEAMRLASDEFARHFKPEEWRLFMVVLQQNYGRWHWTVSWRPKSPGSSNLVNVPVLMSGFVVPLSRLKPME